MDALEECFSRLARLIGPSTEPSECCNVPKNTGHTGDLNGCELFCLPSPTSILKYQNWNDE
jgi:hypothetical protein